MRKPIHTTSIVTDLLFDTLELIHTYQLNFTAVGFTASIRMNEEEELMIE